MGPFIILCRPNVRHHVHVERGGAVLRRSSAQYGRRSGAVRTGSDSPAGRRAGGSDFSLSCVYSHYIPCLRVSSQDLTTRLSARFQTEASPPSRAPADTVVRAGIFI